MEFKKCYTILFAVFVVLLVQNASCRPRDASLQIQRNELEVTSRPNESKEIAASPVPSEDVVTSMTLESEPTVRTEIHHEVIPGRVPCLFEEVTEDPVCQEHCLPKGYSYGVCVSKTCSCI